MKLALRKRGRVQKSYGSQASIEDRNADLSPRDFAIAHCPAERSSFIPLYLRDHLFGSLHSAFLSPCSFTTNEQEDPFATPILIRENAWSELRLKCRKSAVDLYRLAIVICDVSTHISFWLQNVLAIWPLQW